MDDRHHGVRNTQHCEIWVLAHHREGELQPVTLEMLGEGRELADALGGRLCAALLGWDVESLIPPLAHHGAERVYLAQHERLAVFSADAYTAVLTELLQERPPTVFLCGATADGRELAPRLAVRLDVPLISACVRVTADRDGQLVLERMLYGDKLQVTYRCARDGLLLATFQPDARGVDRADPNRSAEVVSLRVELPAEAVRTQHLGYLPAEARTVDLTEAERIVAAGLGVGGSEGMALVQALADRLGAAVGGTRPVVDKGWLPFERQIGTTGKTVAPRLYIACGISGATQHVAGIQGDGTFIAINTDPTAPIFSLADVGLVGDLHAILPEVLRLLGEEEP
jgi:electron transfer flavoprotein alpha subunit